MSADEPPDDIPPEWAAHDPWSPERLEAEVLSLEDARDRRAPDGEDFSAARLKADAISLADERDKREREAIPYTAAPDLADALDASETLPWIELRLDVDGPELVRAPIGAYIVLVGWEGSGKSSMVMQIGIAAARTGFAFVYLVPELDNAEVGARIVGMQTGHSWEDAHRGRVPRADRETALAIPNFVVLTDERATMKNLTKTVERLRANDPERPIITAVDYVQDLEAEGRDERAKVRAASRMLRRTAKQLRTLMLAVSQTSREGRESLRSGEAVGADTATKGAESSQIEKDAYVMLALGNPEKQPDGTVVMDLSCGKARMRPSDVVSKVRYVGRTGRTEIIGEARAASEVREERITERAKKKRETIKLAIVGKLEESNVPLSKADITRRVAGGSTDIAAAIKELVQEGLIAHDHRQVAAHRGHPPLWTPGRIADAATKGDRT